MDLSTMYQNGMGSFASLNAGRQMASDQQMAAEKLKEQQLANENSATMNPLNAQFRQGQIAEQAAQLPGTVGDSQVKASAGQTEAATTGAKIAQRLSSLSGQIGVDGMQKMGREGEIAVQAAQALKGLPPFEHKRMLAEIMQKYGADANSPLIAGVMKMPDEDVQKSLEALGTGMALAGQKYIQESALTKQKNDSSERVADVHAAAQIYTAKIQAASREAAAKTRASVMAKIPKTEDKIALLEEAEADGSATPQESDLLRRLKTHVYSEKAMSAPAVAPTVLGQPTPLQAARQAAVGSGGGTAAPASPHGNVKQVGTSGGRPVFEDEKGNRFIQ